MLTDLFKIGIWVVDISLDNDSISDYCYKLKKDDEAGRFISNRGGWQSKELQGEHTPLNPLFQAIVKHGNDYANGIQLKTKPFEKIAGIWVNINGHKDYNLAHDHPGCAISGVYYVKNSHIGGDIMFDSPYSALMNGYWWDYLKNYNDYTSSQYRSESSTGKLIMFPSWLTHFVMPNKNETEDRISISFNLK